jgi:Ca2+-binding RTX toxin-like protein
MIINISYDSSVDNAPPGFKDAVQAVVQYFESVITSPITLNLQFGYGEVAGQPMDASSVGESIVPSKVYDYATVAAALTGAATSADAKAAAATLPVSNPTGGGEFLVSSAEAKALGLEPGSSGAVDGFVGLSSAFSYSFDPNNRAVPGLYDAIGVLEHEISEVLGRRSYDGMAQTDAPPLYSALDLFKYASAGVRDFTPDGSFFSVDGQTLLSQFNDATQNSGDAGDWASSATPDSFDAFCPAGVELGMSATDLRALNVLGWNLQPESTGAPTAPAASTAAQATLTVTQDASLAQGASLHVTGATGVEIVGAASGQTSPSFSNSGQINVDGAGSLAGVDEAPGSDWAGSTFTNTATGALYVDAASGSAFGFSAAGASSAVDNAGAIQVVAESGDATGLANAGTGGFTNESSGQVIVWASGQALGVAMDGFDNAGLVEATGASATAVKNLGAFSNSGTVVATDVGGAGSVAVEIDARGLLTNTGTVRGDYAFQANDAAISSASSSAGDIDLVNSGLIVGAVDTGEGPAEIHNTGMIDGKIVFGNADSVYDGAGGRQAGGIFLGSATNSVTLGDDGEVVVGGGLADTITGGAGDDVIEIARGDNTIDGGGGYNTLSFADSGDAVSVDLGAGTATATGADAISNIQCVVAGAYAATFQAGASAAKFVGGAGYDTFVGGAGDDTLVAGTGGGMLTGGGGNDTFVFAQGGQQVVITDFGANGDQDVLDVYGFAAPQSVVQQGNDTLITLSGVDSILLKNVQADTLTASEVVYSSATSATGPVLPTETPFGASPVAVTRDLTIDASTTFHPDAVSGDTYALIDGDPNGGSGALPSIDNFGTVGVIGTGTAIGGLYSVASYAHGGTLVNEAGAQFWATAESGVAYGVYGQASAPDIVNKGLFQASALNSGTAAYGVLTPDPDFHFLNESTGQFDIYVQSGAGYGLSVGAAQVENDGNFSVTASQSVGIYEEVASGSGAITNTGMIGAAGTLSAVGIQIGGSGGAVSVTNSGEISTNVTVSGQTTEGVAIEELTDGSTGAPRVSFTNSDWVLGEIDLGRGQDSLLNTGRITAATAIADRNAASGGGGRLDIVNTGQIEGDIVLDGDGSYAGVGGTVSGDIYLADGSDTIDLRGGAQDSGDRIDIAPTAAGAALSDVVYTGAAGGLVSLHAGDANLELHVTGQGATTLEFDQASTVARYTHNADGSWTVSAGADGTATFTGVQTLQFTDRSLSTASLGVAPQGDFSGGQRSDALIQNTAGAVELAESSGGHETYTKVAALGSEWTFHGAGDFLGDGHSQFLIENKSGLVEVGDVSSGHAVYSQISALGSEWKFVGAGDYLGDGKSDFLIENSNGLIQAGEVGANGKAAYTKVAALGPEWKFVGSGDFLGEGHDQFLMQNTSGLVEVGDVNAGHTTYTQVTALGSEWKFVAAGDFLGDGKDQFLIENSKGLVEVAEVGANGKAAFTQVGALGSEWKFVGAGDYLGLGHDQFLIQNAKGLFEAANVVGGKAQYTQLGALGSEWTFRG